ncbi:bifunctional class I SAM-dependent methyltransferase/NUDIX hydrolase [Streptomyces sp. NPDC098781]|uniref:bifunctional class I SAM-dependent methyltransferase/NUDIX hydrolase n=1 Tax=Streptomyces sp. NPDC098781 TaxID=3366097 RepID=UPI00381AE136
MSAHSVNAESWTIYGQRQLDRGYEPPVPEQLHWGSWAGVGPGAEALGDIAGKHVLDIGSGAGHHAVHLARVHGARVTAIEQSPTQHRRAADRFAAEPGVRFLHGDVLDHLKRAEPYDAAYAIGTLAYIDPHMCLPALRDGLRAGAPLVFSVLHTDMNGQRPADTVAPRRQEVLLRQDPPLPVQCWVLTPQLWEDLLTDAGFAVTDIQLLAAPDNTNRVVHQLIRARRRIASRPRTTRPPAPHAAVGVGAIVLGEQGLLLGRHRRGTIELPGGSVESSDRTPQDTVVRELREETGLVARPEDVVLLGTLLDHVGDVVRITVGAIVTAWQGEPATQPDENVGDWRWCALDQLPQHDLFECSAQILAAWRPDLPIDHPPACFTPYAPPEHTTDKTRTEPPIATS